MLRFAARRAEFAVTMTNMKTGAFYSMISAPSAAALNLTAYPAPFGFFIRGVGGGTASASIAKVTTFTLAGVEYDVGQEMVRLIKPKDCNKTTLACWATTTMPLSTMPIAPTTPHS